MTKGKNLTRRKHPRIQKPRTERLQIANQIAAVATVDANHVTETFRVRNVATIINPPRVPFFPLDGTLQILIEMIGICERMTTFLERALF
jgi:hypothetical protein